jgi:hypothetical protein
MTRVVVLVCGDRRRTYPLAADTPLQDQYILGGERWTVVACYRTELVDLNTLAIR